MACPSPFLSFLASQSLRFFPFPIMFLISFILSLLFFSTPLSCFTLCFLLFALHHFFLALPYFIISFTFSFPFNNRSFLYLCTLNFFPLLSLPLSPFGFHLSLHSPSLLLSSPTLSLPLHFVPLLSCSHSPHFLPFMHA